MKKKKDYDNIVCAFAKFDARRVVLDGDARGRWATIRLDTIIGFKTSLEERERLYCKYIDSLSNEISELDPNPRRWGEVPEFQADATNRLRTRKLAVEI